MPNDWLTWQIVDSAFPTGAFAHSYGLEAAWQHGEISGPAPLREFLDAAVLQATYGAMPFVNAAFRSPDRLEALDARADAFLINVVANRASRIQGRTALATIARIWPSSTLTHLARRVAATSAHISPVTGAAFCAIGLPLAVVQRVVLFSTARVVMSAAVRLGITGSYEAQRMQFDLTPRLDDLLQRCADLDERDVVQTSPILDILQSRHDRLYSRLFQS